MNYSLNPNSLLIIFGIVAIIIEVLIGAATGFELLILGIVLVIGGIVGTLTGSFIAAIGTVIILLLAYVILGRGMIKKSLYITTQKTNVESIIGKTALVLIDITPYEPGQIKVEGEIWRAEAAETIKKGEKVIIQSVSGVTVKVIKV